MTEDNRNSLKLKFRKHPAIHTHYSWSNSTISNKKDLYRSFSKPIEVKSGVPSGICTRSAYILNSHWRYRQRCQQSIPIQLCRWYPNRKTKLDHKTIQNYFRRIFVLCTTGLVTTTWSSMPACLSACDMEQTVTSNNFPTSQIQVVLSKREIT